MEEEGREGGTVGRDSREVRRKGLLHNDTIDAVLGELLGRRAGAAH